MQPVHKLRRQRIRYHRHSFFPLQKRSLISRHTDYLMCQLLHTEGQCLIERPFGKSIFMVMLHHSLSYQPPGQCRTYGQQRIYVKHRVLAEDISESIEERVELYPAISQHRYRRVRGETIRIRILLHVRMQIKLVQHSTL